MVASMNLFEVGPIQMGIDLGCGDIRMAQHGLNRPEVCASLQKVSGKRMAQDMGGHFPFYACSKRTVADQLPESLAG